MSWRKVWWSWRVGMRIQTTIAGCTPLLVPSTIAKKVVELGLVIGLRPAVEIDDKLAVGGGTLTAKEKEDDIKYVAELVKLPVW